MEDNNQVSAETDSRCKWCGGQKRGGHAETCRIIKTLKAKRLNAARLPNETPRRHTISAPVPPALAGTEGGHLRVRDLALKMIRCPFCNSQILAQLELFVVHQQGDRQTK